MKLLTATSRSQGQHWGDYAYCAEGETVTLSRVTYTPGLGWCHLIGGRVLAGLNLRRPTTTAMVRDISGYTFGDLTEAVRSYRQRVGSVDVPAEDEAAIIAETAGRYAPGTVLEVLTAMTSP